MQAQVTFHCKYCEASPSATFEISDDARLSVIRQKDIYDGLKLSMMCNACHAKYEGYLIEDNFDLKIHVLGLNESECKAIHLKPAFLDFFQYELADGSVSFRQIVAAIEDTADLLSTVQPITARTQHIFLRMLFVQLVSSMETYLADSLATEVRENVESTRKLLQGDNFLSEVRITLMNAYTGPEAVNERVRQYLGSVLYHNLPKVNVLYRIVFGIGLQFLDEVHMGDLHRAVNLRHDCVHRNGKNEEGEYIKISETYIHDVSTWIAGFVCKTEEVLIAFRRNRPPTNKFDHDIPF